MSARPLCGTAWAPVIVLAMQALALAAERPEPSVAIFDTGDFSPTPLSGQVIASRAGWTELPKKAGAHRFRGDGAIWNGHIMVVFRQNGPGAELYACDVGRPVLRAVLAPATDKASARLASPAVAENAAGRAALDAVFRMPDGKDATVRFELQPGQVFVRTEARGGGQRLRLGAPCRFAVLPDLFADDIVVDATELPVDRAELPSENFLLHMVGPGEAIVLAVWNQRQEDVQITLAGQGTARAIQASEIPYGTKGSVYVALLESHGIWHWHEVSRSDAGRVTPLEWKAPYAAGWRVDWRQEDRLTDSWDMLLQRPDGTYAKPDWFGQAADYGTPGWTKAARDRWTTVLGSFQYPCWIDKDGRGFLQPLKGPNAFRGPALVYPVNRVPATPLTAFTFVDIVRATLGVGRCEYILDVEGQRRKSQGVPTCPTRSQLDDIYARGQQKQRKAQVQQALKDVLAFMRHIRARIEDYVTFGRQTLAYLDERKKAQPELAGFISEMEAIVRRIDQAVASRQKGIHPPEYAAKLVEEFRATLVDYEGPDALGKCRKLTAGFVEIGDNQDELVAQCRLAVRILRQRAALAMAVDPRTAGVAREIRRRTQAMLRNPTGLEAPRH